MRSCLNCRRLAIGSGLEESPAALMKNRNAGVAMTITYRASAAVTFLGGTSPSRGDCFAATDVVALGSCCVLILHIEVPIHPRARHEVA